MKEKKDLSVNCSTEAIGKPLPEPISKTKPLNERVVFEKEVERAPSLSEGVRVLPDNRHISKKRAIFAEEGKRIKKK